MPPQKRTPLFTPEEDELFIELMTSNEDANWKDISKQIGNHTPRQCRDHWLSHLAPIIKSWSKWTEEEEELLQQKVLEFGKKWSLIKKFFDGRNENEIKTHWLKTNSKRLSSQKIDRKDQQLNATFNNTFTNNSFFQNNNGFNQFQNYNINVNQRFPNYSNIYNLNNNMNFPDQKVLSQPPLIDQQSQQQQQVTQIHPQQQPQPQVQAQQQPPIQIKVNDDKIMSTVMSDQNMPFFNFSFDSQNCSELLDFKFDYDFF